ncbi:MAG TPA: hypothetical protein VG966_12195 [Hyphomicrobiaceae bacterium]|nr:hypothetical protein [Hyphomicrobiaceae bacterium]
MSPATLDRLHELLAASLPAWRVAGDVRRGGDGAIAISAAGSEIRVEPAPAGTPFRWMVTVDGRTRGAGSVAGVLRAVRRAIDPGYARLPLRIAPSPGAAS